MTGSKVFVSHASADDALVSDFVHQLLEGAIGVSPHDIFCSSLKGQGIRPGTDFKASIRAHLDDATCVVALISPNFYNSAFCMCELGGTWIQAKAILPILVPPLTFSDLRAVLSDAQALQLSSKEDLDELRDELGHLLGLKHLSTSRWNERRDAFLVALPPILAALPDRTPTPRQVHETTVRELEACKQAQQKLSEDLRSLQQQNDALLKVKDAGSVAAVLQETSTFAEQFDSLTIAAMRAIEPLPEAIREALYYRERKEPYDFRKNLDEGAVRHLLEHGQIQKDPGAWNRYSLCPEDPDVSAATAALDALEVWLRKPPRGFAEWYRSAFGRRPDITLRPFWNLHLLDFAKLRPPPAAYDWPGDEGAF